MIGQKDLLNKISTYTLSSLPHSILLLGERGSEQQMVCEYISDKFNLFEFDITENITKEFIDEIYSSHTLTLYIVDLNKISVKDQNLLLKLYEEPSPYAYIILLSESDVTAIETIKTRSYIFKLSKYSHQDLKPLITQGDEDLILKVCNTPGQIEIANHTDMSKLFLLCDTIIKKIATANIANTLSISSKINFKDEYDKYDLYLFFKVLRYKMLEHKCSINTYKCVINTSSMIWSMNNKQQYFEHFLIELWQQFKLV